MVAVAVTVNALVGGAVPVPPVPPVDERHMGRAEPGKLRTFVRVVLVPSLRRCCWPRALPCLPRCNLLLFSSYGVEFANDVGDVGRETEESRPFGGIFFSFL